MLFAVSFSALPFSGSSISVIRLCASRYQRNAKPVTGENQCILFHTCGFKSELNGKVKKLFVIFVWVGEL